MSPVALIAICASAHAWSVNVNSSGDELHWPEPEVSYTLNTDGAHGLDQGEIEASVAAAAAPWQEIDDVGVKIAYDGPSTTATSDYSDNEHVIYFQEDWPLADTLLAVTYVWSVEEGEIIAYDMAINIDQHEWATDGDPVYYDLTNSLTHEFGHALGLDHSAFGDATMFASTEEGELAKRTIEQDDKQAIRYLYADLDLDVPEANGIGRFACSSTGSGSLVRTALIALISLMGLMGRRGRSVAQGV